MGQMTQMMTAHTGLMTSLLNGTNGMSAMMMGCDGPFDFDGKHGVTNCLARLFFEEKKSSYCGVV